MTHDLNKLVLPPGDKIIQVIPQHFNVDNEIGINDPKGMSGVKLEGFFHIITGQAAAIDNLNRSIAKCGYHVVSMTLEGIASATSVLVKDEREAGVALVDIGGGTTDITIFHDDVIRHTAVIPLGGNIITRDIKTGCKVMQHQAEQIKN